MLPSTAGRFFRLDAVRGATDQSALLAYDPKKAEKLLDDAGWKKGAGGFRSKDGKPLSLTLYSNPYLATARRA